MIRLLPIAAAVCLATAPALAMENLYPPFEALSQSSDYRAHPRSTMDYLPLKLIDPHFLCLNAGHVDQCLWKITGHKFPPPPDFVAFIKLLEEAGRAQVLFGPERETPRKDRPRPVAN